MNLISPLEMIYETITWLIKQEIQQDGLLSDVEMFLSEANTKDHIRAPLVWFDKQAITDEDLYDSEHSTLSVPFNIVCAVDIVNDIEYAERETLNFASRCVTSLYRNFLKAHPTYSDYVEIVSLDVTMVDPNGTFQIMNKTKLMPAARLEVTCRVQVNWMLYLDMQDAEVNYGSDPVRLEDVLFREIIIE